MKALGMKILMPPTQTGHTEGMPLFLCALMKLKLTLLQGPANMFLGTHMQAHASSHLSVMLC